MKFRHQSRIDASAEVVFAFHERPDALELLSPPWQNVEIVEPPRSLEAGTRVQLRVRFGPFRQTIVAEHVAYEPGRSFVDVMLKGPFRHWRHLHLVEPVGLRVCRLVDEVTYELPGGAIAELVAGWIVRRQLARLFRYRHEVTREACEADGA